MGERTEYAPGTFCWADLSTSDPDAAKAFYTGLFGWEHEDSPVDGGLTYTMLKQSGKNVGALYRQQADGPPAWLSYVTVEDADATTARAKELGANVIAGPMDVMSAGRMAVLGDPQGAVFGVWQPGESIGAELVNDPGAMCLNQLNTSEPEDAQRFFGELFGWRFEQVAGGEQPSEGPGAQPAEPAASAYWGIFNGDALNGGMMPLPAEAGPPHWLVYFTSADLDASVSRIEELGGGVLVAPMPVPPSGRIAVARDPQGGVFGLFEGRIDP